MRIVAGRQAVVVFAFSALVATVSAQEVQTSTAGHAQSVTFSLGKIFTFLFLTLGPNKVIGPFAAMTRGHDNAFKRRVAFQATLIGMIAILFAATSGANTLKRWGVSVGALLMTAGIILFLVALKPVLEMYAPHERRPDTSLPGTVAASAIALAFPTIISPYGIAVLIVLITLRADETSVAEILGVAVFTLLLDLLAMLFANQILKTPLLAIGLNIFGVVMGVLQVALGVAAVDLALQLLGYKS